MTMSHLWPRTIVRGHLFGIAAVLTLLITGWLIGPAMQSRLLDIVDDSTAADAPAAQATIQQLLIFLSLGSCLHIALNMWLWRNLRQQRWHRGIAIGAACNILSMPIGTVLGLAVLVRYLQIAERGSATAPDKDTSHKPTASDTNQ